MSDEKKQAKENSGVPINCENEECPLVKQMKVGLGLGDLDSGIIFRVNGQMELMIPDAVKANDPNIPVGAMAAANCLSAVGMRLANDPGFHHELMMWMQQFQSAQIAAGADPMGRPGVGHPDGSADDAGKTNEEKTH
jgi:hypothetical protein